MKGGNDCQEGIKKEVPGEQKWTEVHCIEMHSVRIRDQGIRACYVTAVRVGGTFWGLSLFHPPLFLQDSREDCANYFHFANSCCKTAAEAWTQYSLIFRKGTDF